MLDILKENFEREQNRFVIFFLCVFEEKNETQIYNEWGENSNRHNINDKRKTSW